MKNEKYPKILISLSLLMSPLWARATAAARRAGIQQILIHHVWHFLSRRVLRAHDQITGESPIRWRCNISRAPGQLQRQLLRELLFQPLRLLLLLALHVLLRIYILGKLETMHD